MRAGTQESVGRPLSSVFLSLGFRPFFLAAGLWAVVALGLWIVMFTTGMPIPSRFDPMTWHIHEMLFGFVMAAIAGFLLTAIPNWTGRPPVCGKPLAVLAGLWLLGRIACLVSALMPVWLSTASDLSFSIALAAVVARETVSASDRKNMPMIAPVVLLGVANVLMHFESNGIDVPTGLGWRLCLLAVIVLISVIGGRIIPSFTRNWLIKQSRSDLLFAHGLINKVGLGLLHAGLLGWVVFPWAKLVGVLLILGAVLNLFRLLRWRGGATVAEPLLFILHIGYGWMVLGVALLGLGILIPAIPQTAAIHALTAGAMGTMILAVMTRATLGHTGRALTADRITQLIYLFASVSGLTRVTAAFLVNGMMPLLIVSAVTWIGAFGLFIWHFAPMLLRPRQT